MATDTTKSTPAQQDSPYPPPPVAYPPAFNGAPFPQGAPPGAYPPPFYAPFPPPSDGAHPENGQNGVAPAQYMMFHSPPPGMVFAYAPPQGQGYNAPQNTQNPATRPKRKQVKMACTNCANACKRCDEHRPCDRCVKYGISDTCIDGQRKERKKGIKRGPYKRKNKAGIEPTFTAPDGGWATAHQPPAGSAGSAPPSAGPPVPPFPPPPGEAFYPYFYTHPGTFMPHPHEGQPGQEGSSHPNGQTPIMPGYYVHPGGYAPFPPYPLYTPPGVAPPHISQHPPQPTHGPESADASKKASTPVNGGEANGVSGTSENTAKRPRTSKGEGKAKKAKTVNPRDINGTKEEKGPADGEANNS